MLALVVATHFAVIIGHVVALLIIPFYCPWYLALPVCGYIVNLMLQPGECVLTRIEDWIRRSLNMPEIKLFIKHYVVKPILKAGKEK